jgi:protocatechuate 3,4-dioxygenase beta subunit
MKSFPPASPPLFRPQHKPLLWSRRDNLKALGLLPLLGSGLVVAPARAEVSCSLAPEMTEGPYWVDEKLNRADVRTGTTRASVVNATPMALDILLNDSAGQLCGNNPVRNVQVDIWHCDAAGEYSGVSGAGQSSTVGQDFLRGYQVSGNDGRVSFTTIYPGWYGGRATHIHVRARVYDASGNTTYNFSTQLFFDDAFTDQVYTHAPYNQRGTRDTRNSNDWIYNAANTPPLVSVVNTSQSNGAPLHGEVAIGLTGLPASTMYREFAVTTANQGTATVPALVSQMTVASGDVGSIGEIYVAADVAGRWYFNNGSFWVRVQDPRAGFPAFHRGTLGATHTLNVLSGMDTSALGRINLYAGYGADNLDMLQNQRYRFLYSLN